MAKRKSSKPSIVGSPVMELKVYLIDGPITEKFAKKNKEVSRTIAIRGDQTLDELHEAIFAAFDREDAHMWEFQIGGKRPMDKKGKRYVLPMAMDGDDWTEPKPTALAEQTTLASLGLKKSTRIFYWFDFGDDWWHEVVLEATHAEVPAGKYPRVIAKNGESPPQYP